VVRAWPQFFAIDGVSEIGIHQQRQAAVFAPRDEAIAENERVPV
jgi:hypothetical protein